MTPSVKAAAPDPGAFAASGLAGVLFYAMLLIIAWLLIRDWLKDRLIWNMAKASRDAEKAMANAMFSVTASLSSIEMALGVEQIRRDVAAGKIPSGLID